MPRHLAVNDNEFVFVADFYNRRVTLLSPTLNYVGQVLSRDQLTGEPGSGGLCLDVQRRRLYVTQNELEDGEDKPATGRVEIFTV